MERVPAVPIREHFASLTDPRCANARHHLLDILADSPGFRGKSLTY
jgi:hypothetical protein